MWQLQVGAQAGWAIHGAHLGYLNMVIPNVIGMALGIVVIHMVARDRGLRLWALAPIPLAVAAALIVVEFTASGPAFGAAALIPLAAGALAQSRSLIIRHNITGVAPLFLRLAVVVQALWLVWGLLVGDGAIIVCASVLGLIAVFNLTWHSLRVTGHVPVYA